MRITIKGADYELVDGAGECKACLLRHEVWCVDVYESVTGRSCNTTRLNEITNNK